jgi:hypothetical protein
MRRRAASRLVLSALSLMGLAGCNVWGRVPVGAEQPIVPADRTVGPVASQTMPPPASGMATASAPRRSFSEPLCNFQPIYAPSMQSGFSQSGMRMSAADAQRCFAGKTRLTRSFGITQVTYSAPDGRIFLWYPGNQAPLPGTWRIVSANANETDLSRAVAALCFRYPGSHNPGNPALGDREQCIDAAGLARGGGEIADGDIFALATRRQVPFVTAPREALTFEVIQARMRSPEAGAASAVRPSR